MQAGARLWQNAERGDLENRGHHQDAKTLRMIGRKKLRPEAVGFLPAGWWIFQN
jgi:hypothetical protein